MGTEGLRRDVWMGFASSRLERVREGEGGLEVEVEVDVEGKGVEEGLVRMLEGWKAARSFGGVGGLIMTDGADDDGEEPPVGDEEDPAI